MARTVVKAPKSSHITPILRSLHWLKINERIEYKLLSLTYKVLTTSQPDYLHNLISVQSTDRTRSSSVVTLARPSVSSSLQITNRCFRYASPHLWNQLPSRFRRPYSVHSPPSSPHPAHITSSQSSLLSPITPSIFHSSLSQILSSHSLSDSFPTAFMYLNLYWIKGALAFVWLVSSFLIFFLATCARLSWILSFRVHIKLFYHIVSYRNYLNLNAHFSKWTWVIKLLTLRWPRQISIHWSIMWGAILGRYTRQNQPTLTSWKMPCYRYAMICHRSSLIRQSCHFKRDFNRVLLQLADTFENPV